MSLAAAASSIPHPRRWVEPVARVGYATKGVLQMAVGALAVAAATDLGGGIGGAPAAARTIGEQPFGEVLLGIIAIGMFSLATFRALEAIFDMEGASSKGTRKAVVHRVGYAIGAITDGALGVLAAQMAWGDRPSSGGGREWLSRVLSWHPVGPVLVGIVGLGVIGFALFQLHRAWTTDFQKHLRTSEIGSDLVRRLAIAIGRVGLAAHGIVLGIIGVGLVRAAIGSSPRQPVDVGSALREIGTSGGGQTLLAIVAVGLFAHGVYGLVEARYRALPSSA